MSRVMIRAYVADDFEQLIRLYKDKDTYGGNYDPGRDTKEKLLETSSQDNLLVAEEDGAIVGSVMILDNPHTFWLLRFVIAADTKNKDNIAKELDEVVRNVALDRGHKSIIVYTDPSRDNLLGRYRRLGYEESSDYRCFWKGVEQ